MKKVSNEAFSGCPNIFYPTLSSLIVGFFVFPPSLSRFCHFSWPFTVRHQLHLKSPTPGASMDAPNAPWSTPLPEIRRAANSASRHCEWLFTLSAIWCNMVQYGLIWCRQELGMSWSVDWEMYQRYISGYKSWEHFFLFLFHPCLHARPFMGSDIINSFS